MTPTGSTLATTRYIAVLLAFAVFLGVSADAPGQTAAPAPAPAPKPPVGTSPPAPPPGPAPWRNGPDRFLVDEDAVRAAIEKSKDKRLVLEDYRLSTEGSLRKLEEDRAAGTVGPKIYKDELREYRKSINVYRGLSMSPK